MDIASLSTALSMTQTSNDVGTLMLSKQLDLMETQGDSMVKALEQSVNPHLGSNFDAYA
ncbi:MAG: putative motility protein [Lachnospiraceae bacterium]|nr:putative motility protein [Lachnospiraceae bacterium]MCI9150618.1 putative motility protein [Lachnospiraceae bacterium]